MSAVETDVGTAGGASNAALTEFRARLLAQTLGWCTTRSAFYRRHWGAAANQVRCVADLSCLPVLERHHIIENAADLLCDASLPVCVQNTSGTTGTLMQMYRGRSEVAFIWDFFSRQIQMRDPRPLYLALTSAYHGAPTPLPSAAFVLNAGVYDRTQARQARSVLEARYALPGVDANVSVIVGADILVKALTAFLLADGFDLRSAGIRALLITGGHISAARKRLLADLWGAVVQDRYSLSEVFGGAAECGIGGPWVFDPHVIPEVVHPRTLQPVQEGVGLLVLTGLYPFMQQMPLVRYHTGDLVEIADSTATGAADLLVRFVGRQRRSIVDDSGDAVVPLLLANPLHDALEDVPDIAATGRFADLQAGPGLEFAGKLHYEVYHAPAVPDVAPESITLRLGLRYAPWLFPSRVAGVQTAVRARLYRRFPGLRERVDNGSLRFTIEAAEAAAVMPFNAK